MRAEINKLNESTKSTMAKIQKDYNKDVSHEKSQLETKLINLRKKNNNMLSEEAKRFDQIMNETKSIHKDKLAEIQISQDKEVEGKQLEHRDYLENAKLKFESEKAKIEA